MMMLHAGQSPSVAPQETPATTEGVCNNTHCPTENVNVPHQFFAFPVEGDGFASLI